MSDPASPRSVASGAAARDTALPEDADVSPAPTNTGRVADRDQLERGFRR